MGVLLELDLIYHMSADVPLSRLNSWLFLLFNKAPLEAMKIPW